MMRAAADQGAKGSKGSAGNSYELDTYARMTSSREVGSDPFDPFAPLAPKRDGPAAPGDGDDGFAPLPLELLAADPEAEP